LQGAEWERPVHFEYFDENWKQQLNQNIGFRIHGATTRSYPQKSLRLYASEDYDDENAFPNIFFMELNDFNGVPVESFSKLLLRSSGNNRNFPMFRDNLLSRLVSHTSLDIHANRPVNVFLNGEYWGFYNLREYLNEDFLAARYDLDVENIVILENYGRIVEGKTGDDKPYQEMLKLIREDVIRDPNTMVNLDKLMDIDNFIDFQVAQIYSRNENWPHDNNKFWRYKNDDTQTNIFVGQDGRWRWLLHDLDTTFGVVGGKSAAQENTLTKAEGEFLFRNLLEYEEFRNEFINRFADHLNTSFLPSRVISVIDEMENEIAPDLPEHLQRWAILEGSVDAWKSNVQVIRDFVKVRPAYVRDRIIKRFGLAGIARLSIRHDNNRGVVRVNSIELTATTPGIENADSWTGVYFKGIPVTLEAKPRDGFEFAGWEGIDESSDTVTLYLEGDLTVRAIFLPNQE
jgi:hypothetical protein